jgi:hypothetical protein
MACIRTVSAKTGLAARQQKTSVDNSLIMAEDSSHSLILRRQVSQTKKKGGRLSPPVSAVMAILTVLS